MLKKEQRLKTEDFKELPKTQKYYTQNFTIRLVNKGNGQNGQKNDQFGRFAVVAPKKLYKQAVLRNRAKRLVYDLLKSIKTQPANIFIFINKDVLGLDKEQIKKELNSILCKK